MNVMMQNNETCQSQTTHMHAYIQLKMYLSLPHLRLVLPQLLGCRPFLLCGLRLLGFGLCQNPTAEVLMSFLGLVLWVMVVLALLLTLWWSITLLLGVDIAIEIVVLALSLLFLQTAFFRGTLPVGGMLIVLEPSCKCTVYVLEFERIHKLKVASILGESSGILLETTYCRMPRILDQRGASGFGIVPISSP